MGKKRKKLKKFLTYSKSSQLTLILFVEIILGLFIIISALGIFFDLTYRISTTDTNVFDVSVRNLVYTLRSPTMTPIMAFITFFGGEIFLDFAILVSILFLLKKRQFADALIFSFTLILSVSLNFYLKNVFHRARPDFMPLAFENTYSFPSGHSMNSFVFFACLSYFILRRFKNQLLGQILIICSIVLVFLIGVSRIYLGVHYPSDVLAGYAAGLMCFVLVLLFQKTILFLRLFRKYKPNSKV